MSSDDCVGNDYISSSSSGYSDFFINFDYYDRYELGDNEDDRDDSSELYAYPVDSAQFEFDIKNYMDKIESDPYHRWNGCAQSQTLKKQMDRVYPRYSVLFFFCIDTKVNKGDKSKITESLYTTHVTRSWPSRHTSRISTFLLLSSRTRETIEQMSRKIVQEYRVSLSLATSRGPLF